MTNAERIEAIKDRMPDQRWRNVNFGYYNEWEDLLIETDEKLAALDPAYTIVQVKEKFGGLRYYFSPSEGTNEDVAQQMREITWAAEARSYDLVKK